MRVQLYRNLNKSREVNVWSLKEARAKPCASSGGKVRHHVDIALLTDCCFTVNETGRQTVLRTRQKNVHAWVEGELADMAEHPSGWDPAVLPPDVYEGRWIPITYNPYKGPDFRRVDTGAVVAGADYVAATPSGIAAIGFRGSRHLAGLPEGPIELDPLCCWNG